MYSPPGCSSPAASEVESRQRRGGGVDGVCRCLYVCTPAGLAEPVADIITTTTTAFVVL